MKTKRETIRFAIEAHGDQKYGELPYAVHLMLVAQHFSYEPHFTVAVLHDTLEDTKVTIEQLRDEFGDQVADAVDALTRRQDEIYLGEYMTRVKANSIARIVKMADLEENINSASLWYLEFSGLIGRYRSALNFLREP